MKNPWIYGVLWCLVSLQAGASDFCEGADLVPLDHLLKNESHFLDRRIQTRAVLTTDAKEYTRLWSSEKSNYSVLTTADEESSVYSQKHKDLGLPRFNVVSDMFEKIRAMEGASYKRDMSKIRYYRQDVLACGRLTKEQGEIRFALDDIRIERSYMLPWKERKSSDSK
ncbi:hypothetical protein [Rhodanobacter lindaniclasticus]|uniref:hypothetical protein n=1 Tax=Rhodanobacter lindaniclasticus TaxID=75310 RepID=UPI0010A0266C|nr:hypothetical protein [Rhodanobacter lindaniclasticus]